MVLPSDGRNAWNDYMAGTFPDVEEDGSPNCPVLCFWGFLPLPWYTLPFCFAIFIKNFLFLLPAHQALHWGPLYKHIHKLHHKHSAPFGLAAEYAHPAEVLVLGTGTIGGPLLFCYITRDLHIVTVLTWITLRLFQAVDAHSGYGQ